MGCKDNNLYYDCADDEESDDDDGQGDTDDPLHVVVEAVCLVPAVAPVWVFAHLSSALDVLSPRKSDNALWVKSGNRGNLKCLKVNNHFALIFHRKIFISFLSDAKLPKV